MFKHLSEAQATEIAELILKYPGLFGDVPSRTDWVEHEIDVGDAQPIRKHFHRVSPVKCKYLDAEVQYMVENDIAVPSSSKTLRFCTDFQKVSKVTEPDSFPLPRMGDCIDQVGATKYISKLDLL